MNRIKNIVSNAVIDLGKDGIKKFILISGGVLFVFIFGEDTIADFREPVLDILNYIFEVFTYEIQIWIALLLILFLYLGLQLYSFQKAKINHNFIKYGLKWATRIKNRQVIDIHGPFCTNCEYELSDSDLSEKSKCPKCNNKYPTNEDGVKNLLKNVTKIVEADLRVGNVLNVDWFTYGFPDTSLSISNNGSFVAEDISLEINMDVNDENYHIGSFSINRLPPDETKEIDDPDPSDKISEILTELKLIEINTEPFENSYINDMGNEVYFDDEFIWTDLVEHFSAEFIINIKYLFMNELKTATAKYRLTLKYKDVPPKCEYEGNFTASLYKIK